MQSWLSDPQSSKILIIQMKDSVDFIPNTYSYISVDLFVLLISLHPSRGGTKHLTFAH